jgi:hypothetical protein
LVLLGGQAETRNGTITVTSAPPAPADVPGPAGRLDLTGTGPDADGTRRRRVDPSDLAYLIGAAEILATAAERLLDQAQARPARTRGPRLVQASGAAGTADDLAHDVLRQVLARRHDDPITAPPASTGTLLPAATLAPTALLGTATATTGTDTATGTDIPAARTSAAAPAAEREPGRDVADRAFVVMDRMAAVALAVAAAGAPGAPDPEDAVLAAASRPPARARLRAARSR